MKIKLSNAGTLVTPFKVPTGINIEQVLTSLLQGYVTGNTHITVSDTAPSNPSVNDIWIDTSS